MIRMGFLEVQTSTRRMLLTQRGSRWLRTPLTACPCEKFLTDHAPRGKERARKEEKEVCSFIAFASVRGTHEMAVPSAIVCPACLPRTLAQQRRRDQLAG